MSVCSHLCRPLVKGLPAAAAHDQEPRVGVPLSQEEEGVPAFAGGPPAVGPVRERGAQVRERQPQEAAGGSAVRGERPGAPALPVNPHALREAPRVGAHSGF